MRIASNMMSYGFLRSLNKSMERQNDIQEQMSDGKALHRPSDDPIKTVRDLRFKTSQVLNEQYIQNQQDAQSWMENTDGAMSDLSSVMTKINELVISADDTKPTDALNTIGTQIDDLINHVVSLGNTKIGDRYLFAGQNDLTQPFVRKTIKDPNSDLTKEVVVYNGDDNRISMPLTSGAVNPSQDSVNLTGSEVFGPTNNIYGQKTMGMLNHLLEIKNELMKKSTVTQTNATGGIGTVGGTYTGAGYKNFDVKIDSALAGHVAGASFSTDGGNTWTAAPSITSTGNPTKITLTDGITFNITDSAGSTGNQAGNVYSFRVPQAAFKVVQSNTAGGAGTVTGTYTGTEATPYTVKITGISASGQVTGVDYSTNGGTSEPQVDGNNDGLDDTTGAAMKPDTNWTAATVDTSNATVTIVTLPNGVKLNIPTDVDNKVADTYSFTLPQGKGPNTTWLSDVATQYVNDDHNLQLKAQTNLGARMSMYELAYSMLQNQNTVIQTDVANTEDIDMAKAITDFTTSQSVYKSALEVGARIMQPSLIDFLQ